MVLIGNHSSHIESAQKLIHHLSRPEFELPTDFLTDFLKMRIFEKIKGFYVTQFPLWKLGCLLNENWLEEDVLNCMSELLYFRAHVMMANTSRTFLYPPTNFFTDARRLFSSTPREYSAELLALRERVRSTSKCEIGFNACLDNHFSAYYHGAAPYSDLEHGDSTHEQPTSNVLAIFRWVFFDVMDSDHLPLRIKTDLGARQGMGNGGDGSCGLASHNFSERRIDSDVPQWSGPTSRLFRNRALRDLLVYHNIVSRRTGETFLGTWVVRCVDSMTAAPGVDPFCAYNDFNVFTPRVSVSVVIITVT